MANFPPLKQRFLETLGQALKGVEVPGRFLDFGAGSGDVSDYLLSEWSLEGDLVEADEVARLSLESAFQPRGSQIFSSLNDVGKESYGMITAFDVIEHLSKPHERLQELTGCLMPGGLMALVVPYRPSTWGWDDRFYGHLRRWSLRGVINAVETAGLEVLKVTDPTFPTYSTLRRFMLMFKRPGQEPADARAATLVSSRNNAWGDVPSWVPWMPWNLLNAVNRACEHQFRGDELFVLARKTNRDPICGICGRADMTWWETFGHQALQRCRNCQSQRLITARPENTAVRKTPKLVASELRHARDILNHAPSSQSVLEVGCDSGVLLKELKSLGWEVQGIEWRDSFKTSDGIPVHEGTLLDFDAARTFDLVVLFGELEFMERLPECFDRLAGHLNPGGHLVIEMYDVSRPSRALLRRLSRSVSLLNARAVCDQLGSRDLALIHEKKKSGGRVQLWFQKPLEVLS